MLTGNFEFYRCPHEVPELLLVWTGSVLSMLRVLSIIFNETTTNLKSERQTRAEALEKLTRLWKGRNLHFSLEATSHTQLY